MPEILSAETIAAWRVRVEGHREVLSLRALPGLFDSHEALRSLLSDRDETIKALRDDKERLDAISGCGATTRIHKTFTGTEWEATVSIPKGPTTFMHCSGNTLREAIDKARGVSP